MTHTTRHHNRKRALGHASGRPRKPTALAKADGTWRPDRANPAEPAVASVALPAPPARCSDTEREVWRGLAPVVDAMHVATAADVECFEALVLSLAMVRECRAATRVHGLTYETKGGAVVARPEVQLIATHMKLVAVWVARLGLTPADRAKVSTLGGDAPDSALAEFLE